MRILGALGISDVTIVVMICRYIRPFRIYDGHRDVHGWSISQRVLRSGHGV